VRPERLKAIRIGRCRFVQKQLVNPGKYVMLVDSDVHMPFRLYLDSQEAPGPSVEFIPGALV